MSAHGNVHWTELMTPDVEAAKAYYETVCGWHFNEMEMPEGPYFIGMNGQTPTVGIMEIDAATDDCGPHWLTYFGVDNIETAVAQTREVGGSLVRDPFDVPGVGRIAIAIDPTGARVGLIAPA